MIELKDFRDGAYIFMCIDQLIAFGVERRHPGRQLTAILDIQQ